MNTELFGSVNRVRYLEKDSSNMLCIYHANCLDGAGAAWVVKRKFPEIELYPASYGDNPPNVLGKDVIIVDFSYKRDTLIELAKTAQSIKIIDHHITAQENLVNLPDNVFVNFDMSHSGAVLAWKHYFPDAEVPWFISHIGDRDLWKFEMVNTEAVCAYLSALGEKEIIEHFDKMFNNECSISEVVSAGQIVLKKTLKDIKEMLNTNTTFTYIGGVWVPVANIPGHYASEAGNILCKRFPTYPFSATYYIEADKVKYSLRSLKGFGANVSNIAKVYGGGGHVNAAGFYTNDLM